MGRAARRAQQRAERRQRQREAQAPRGPRTPVTAPSGAPEAARRGSLLRPRWLTDIIGELRRVTWPTRQETTHLTVVVIVVSIMFGVLLGSADLVFNWLIEQTLFQ